MKFSLHIVHEVTYSNNKEKEITKIRKHLMIKTTYVAPHFVVDHDQICMGYMTYLLLNHFTYRGFGQFLCGFKASCLDTGSYGDENALR